jgi:amino acid transporter
MTKLLIVVAVLLASSAAAADVPLQEYTNGQFGYALRYPAVLVPEPERTDGRGRDLVTPDGKFRIEVYAKPVGSGDEYLNNRYNKELQWFGSAVTYKVKKSSWYVVSGVTADGTEFYSKGYTNGAVLTSFRITYPHAQHRVYDRWVTRIEKNFVPAR